MSFGACAAILLTSVICSGSFAIWTRSSYLVAALQKAIDGRGRSELALLDSLQPVSPPTASTPTAVARARVRRMTRLCPVGAVGAESGRANARDGEHADRPAG